MKTGTYKDHAGRRRERLVAVRKADGTGRWWFRCDCGNEKVLHAHNVFSGTTYSCGCLINRDKRTHGMSKTRFYKIWKSMRKRCNNPVGNRFDYYGGKGIKVEWITFEQFRDDMYKSYLSHIDEHGEKNTTIDRKDGEKNYSKENCRWATYQVQASNRKIRHTPLKGDSYSGC